MNLDSVAVWTAVLPLLPREQRIYEDVEPVTLDPPP